MIIEEYRKDIKKAYPNIMRRIQGYNLEPLPTSKILCTVHFSDLLECISTVAPILEHKPSAVEIMDEDVVIRAR